MLISLLINFVVVAVCVLIHFEAINLLSNTLFNAKRTPRISILFSLLACFFAHIIEVIIFAFAYYGYMQVGGFGQLVPSNLDAQHLTSSFHSNFIDCIYFSLTCYTSLGFGDLVPTGWLRFLAGVEALTGLLLIAWTASFMYLEMQKHWRVK
ncbi:potassium channel family protein [Cellvibrio sp. OA-2007]|uniref:potassium channel family protein n=1 Tax=Cellvibrio sp. OA-2007 TaxID=529823 RepID=UPI00078120D4|nr:potassium channel family protein [Cellvibrio sp. OA-2007]